MWAVRKVVVGIFIVAVFTGLLILMLVRMSDKNVNERAERGHGVQPVDADTIPAGSKINPDPSDPGPGTDQSSTPSLATTYTYHDSDEVLQPYKLSKNPYQWRGHSATLEMRMPVITSDGTLVGLVPLSALKFRRMISEHVAIYEVIVSNEELGDELAVTLPDSDPPDTARPWKVLVDDPFQATSGNGVPLTLTSLKFEGYKDAPKLASPEPTKQPEQ